MNKPLLIIVIVSIAGYSIQAMQQAYQYPPHIQAQIEAQRLKELAESPAAPTAAPVSQAPELRYFPGAVPAAPTAPVSQAPEPQPAMVPSQQHEEKMRKIKLNDSLYEEGIRKNNPQLVTQLLQQGADPFALWRGKEDPIVVRIANEGQNFPEALQAFFNYYLTKKPGDLDAILDVFVKRQSGVIVNLISRDQELGALPALEDNIARALGKSENYEFITKVMGEAVNVENNDFATRMAQLIKAAQQTALADKAIDVYGHAARKFWREFKRSAQ